MADDPIMALTNPTGLCVWWGLHRLWTLRCQKAVRRMEVGTLSVVMALGGYLHGGTSVVQQHRATTMAERLSIWFWQHSNICWGRTPQ